MHLQRSDLARMATRLFPPWLVACSVALALFAAPAAADAPLPTLPELTLAGTDGAPHALRARAAKAKLLVVTFFDSKCPCQKAHDPRLRELYDEWHARGVELVAVDSNPGSSLEHDREEARARNYPYPILRDPGAKLADALGAEYATQTMIIDPKGRVRYRGGIDGSTVHIKPDGPFFLRDAIADLMEGRAPRDDGSRGYGCQLRR